jgi:hypothetical protein
MAQPEAVPVAGWLLPLPSTDIIPAMAVVDGEALRRDLRFTLGSFVPPSAESSSHGSTEQAAAAAGGDVRAGGEEDSSSSSSSSAAAQSDGELYSGGNCSAHQTPSPRLLSSDLAHLVFELEAPVVRWKSLLSAAAPVALLLLAAVNNNNNNMSHDSSSASKTGLAATSTSEKLCAAVESCQSNACKSTAGSSSSSSLAFGCGSVATAGCKAPVGTSPSPSVPSAPPAVAVYGGVSGVCAAPTSSSFGLRRLWLGDGCEGLLCLVCSFAGLLPNLPRSRALAAAQAMRMHDWRKEVAWSKTPQLPLLCGLCGLSTR